MHGWEFYQVGNNQSVNHILQGKTYHSHKEDSGNCKAIKEADSTENQYESILPLDFEN